MKNLLLVLFGLFLTAAPATAQTIIDLEKGGKVRAKTIDDYKADAAGQHHEGIALAHHDGFAVVQVGAAERHVQEVAHEVAPEENVGHYAVDACAAVVRRLRQYLHHALARAAVDQRAPCAPEPSAYVFSRLAVGGRQVGF